MEQYGLIGLPLTHSFSKRFFTEKFERENIKANYNLYELPTIAELSNLLENNTLNGLNVTIPYKEKVMEYLQDLDETAIEIGAVNVIKFIRRDGKLILKGYNSDAIGFEKSIAPWLQPHHQKALILGTGGASKAIHYVFRKRGIETMFVSRTKSANTLTYSELTEEILANYTIIVNASPVGTYPHSDECPAIPYEYISNQHLLFDAVYNPAETLFLKKGKAQGAHGINGEGMLIGQAEAAWEIWQK